MTPRQVLQDVLQTALIVVAVGLVLFAVSGIWPPMVAVESQSMEPGLERGDLVFVSDPDRFGPDGGADGVVTASEARAHHTLGGPGDVVVYQTPGRAGRGQSPVIHRAMFRVEGGENWYDRANSSFVRADSCRELLNCPAPHDGYITKGDNNAYYDQAARIAPPVRRGWVRAEAQFRIPWLGQLRLWLSGR